MTMEVKTPHGTKYLLYNEKRHSVFLSPKESIEGMKGLNSLTELDKLLPRQHKWRITDKGGVTWRTDEEIAKAEAERKASHERGVKRRAAAAERKTARLIAVAVRKAKIAERRTVIADVLAGRYPRLAERFEAIQKRKTIETLRQQKAALDAAISTLRPKKAKVAKAVVDPVAAK